MKDRQITALLLIISVSVTFYSCERQNEGLPPRNAKGEVQLGGKLRVAESVDPKVLLPFDITDPVASRIGSLVHCGLLRFDPTSLELIPGIAESWSIDSIGTTYVFTLRKGAKFHADECFGNKSRTVTANDFLYSFQKLCEPEGGKAFDITFKGQVVGALAFRNGEAATLDGVRVLDDYTLKILLEKPDPSFLFILAQSATAVVSEKAVTTYGPEKVIGAGPFRFVSGDDGLLLVRNVDYFIRDEFGNQLPFIDTLIVKNIPQRDAQLSAFFNGELDLVTNIHPDPVGAILEQHISDFSGKDPKYVMQREPDEVGYESYSIYRSGLRGFKANFLGYQDYSEVRLSN